MEVIPHTIRQEPPIGRYTFAVAARLLESQAFRCHPVSPKRHERGKRGGEITWQQDCVANSPASNPPKWQDILRVYLAED